jgi:hypothetical protein
VPVKLGAVVVVVCFVAVAAAACGPVQYVGQVTRRASSSVAAAKAAGADKWAPYEYTMAVQFLHKSREEAGYSDYQAAIRFGKKAEIYARKATKIALDRADGPAGDDGDGDGAGDGAGEGDDENPIDPSDSPRSPE